jgi:hypothetical protein
MALWNKLAQGGAAVAFLVGAWLRPPPTGEYEDDKKLWLRVGQLVATVVVGVVFVLARKRDTPDYTRHWLVAALFLLVPSIFTLIAYQHWQYSWTCSYPGKGKVLVGSEYNTHGREYVEEHPDITVEELLLDHGGLPELVWTRDSIIRRQTVLLTVYLGCVPLMAGGILCLLQALYCASAARKRERKSHAEKSPPPP